MGLKTANGLQFSTKGKRISPQNYPDWYPLGYGTDHTFC